MSPEKIRSVQEDFPHTDEIFQIAEIFKILGDPTRLKILLALGEEELCVCDLAALLELSVSAVSHQLRVLRNLKLVKFRREGKMIYYSLDDWHIESIIEQALIHARE